MDILLVEDDKDISDLIVLYLKNDNYKVHAFDCAEPVLDYLNQQNIDLAIIDVMLPGENGLELCIKLRKQYLFPIIILTAKAQMADKIMGLTIGADDYMTKPFMPVELMARVKAQLRRVNAYSNGTSEEKERGKYRYRELELDVEKHICRIGDHEIMLTPKEFGILKLLLANLGSVVSSEKLFSQVWGEKHLENSNNTVMVHIRHIREKIGLHSKENYIETVWGVGYKIGT